MEKAGIPVYPNQYAAPPIQVAPPQHAAAAPGAWTTGLCGCFEDCKSCCMAACCCCIPFGEIANIVDRGATSCTSAACIFCLLSYVGCACIYTCGFRAKLRRKYGLPEAPCNDFCVDWCCLCCSIAQQYRELQNRGIQPSFGFEEVRHIYDQPPPIQMMQQY